MAGVADKARFYLERAVPQLRGWEEKEIFSKDEIRTIVQKRNDYEHRVLSPGNKPSDWSSYAQWEQSLESLRSKRCKRLRIRHLQSAHAGQGRTLAIYERGVNRHPGSSALWREYLSYTSSVKASKRWRKTMTNALRMMPTDPELWTMAGRRSAKNGDMAAAPQPRISQHVLDTLDQEYTNHPATCNVHIRQPIMGVNPQTAEFPKNLREVLSRLNRYLETTTDRTELQKKTVAWIDGYLALDVLDEGIRAVLEHTKQKMESI
ncbi:hypothetical protein FPRO04_03406 [Fusarium proliferatum]|nr:hypothetical protein FPRO04_03406 [Fusarium proliferatum]